jgi:uncharacterized protein DUF6484
MPVAPKRKATVVERDPIGVAVDATSVDAVQALGEARSLLEVALLSPPPRIEGIVVGQIRWSDREMRVTFPGCPSPEGVPARSMVPLEISDGGSEVALMFESGDPRRPCILGKMMVPPVAPVVECRVDAGATEGERLVIRAEKEIVFECGDASITLTRAGKVLIRGAYVLSASTGVQRILGATVEIN